MLYLFIYDTVKYCYKYMANVFGRWFRQSESSALYPVPSSQRIVPSQTLLLIKNADERDAGKWVRKFLSIFIVFIFLLSQQCIMYTIKNNNMQFYYKLRSLYFLST